MARGIALVATLITGGLVAFQPPANALLARHVGDLGAAFISLLLSAAIVGALLVVAGDVSGLAGINNFRPEHSLGAIAGAAIVVVSLITVRSLGAGGVAAALVGTQLILSALIDRLGLLGVQEVPLSQSRVVGIALLIVGTILVTSR
jgi:transporter family-2 protein